MSLSRGQSLRHNSKQRAFSWTTLLRCSEIINFASLRNFSSESTSTAQKRFFTTTFFSAYRELEQTTTTTATRTLPDKRFNEQNNSCARSLLTCVVSVSVGFGSKELQREKWSE